MLQGPGRLSALERWLPNTVPILGRFNVYVFITILVQQQQYVCRIEFTSMYTTECYITYQLYHSTGVFMGFRCTRPEGAQPLRASAAKSIHTKALQYEGYILLWLGFLLSFRQDCSKSSELRLLSQRLTASVCALTASRINLSQTTFIPKQEHLAS